MDKKQQTLTLPLLCARYQCGFYISDSLYSYVVCIHSHRQTSIEVAIYGKELGIQNKIPHDAQVKNIGYAKR